MGMRVREVRAKVRVDRPPDAVWNALTRTSLWADWWFGNDRVVEVVPGWQTGASLKFLSGWSPVVSEFEPPGRLRFGHHQISLTPTGDACTVVAWVNESFEGDEWDDPRLFEDFRAGLEPEMVAALDRFKAAVEAH